MSNASGVDHLLAAWAKRLRFAVKGFDGRFSTAWAVWEHRDTLYVASRSVSGCLKISLHPEGGYRFAFTKEFYPNIKDRSPAFRTRDLVIWPKPNLSNAKATLVASISFPTDYLRSGPPPSSAKSKYLLFEAPPAGWATIVGFFLSRLPPEQLEPSFLRFGKPLFHWSFEDQSGLSLVGWVDKFDSRILPTSFASSAMVPLTASGKIGDVDLRANLTCMFWNRPAPGEPLRLVEAGGVTLSKR